MLTVINSGTNPLSGIAIAASQGFAITNNACNITVASGASCTVGVTFAPQATGAQQGTVQVTASGASVPFSIPVSGTGADFQLSVQGASSSTVTGGSSATYQLLLTPVGASAGQVAFTCTGAPAGSTCSANPANVTMTGTGATATVQVTVITAATSARSRPGMPWGTKSIAGVVLASLVFWRRRRWARLAGAAGAGRGVPGVEWLRAFDQRRCRWRIEWQRRKRRTGNLYDHGRCGRAGGIAQRDAESYS